MYTILRRLPLSVETTYRVKRNINESYANYYFTELIKRRQFNTLAKELCANPFYILSIRKNWHKLFDVLTSDRDNELKVDEFSLMLDCIFDVQSRLEQGDHVINLFFHYCDPVQTVTNQYTRGSSHLVCTVHV